MVPKARVQKRLYYKIGEACKALGIQPYVLRYWETEFPALSPSKSRSGQRVYSEKELEIIRRIKQLLYDEGYTIAGAKKKLEGELAAGTLGEPAQPAQALFPESPPAAAAGLSTDPAEGSSAGLAELPLARPAAVETAAPLPLRPRSPAPDLPAIGPAPGGPGAVVAGLSPEDLPLLESAKARSPEAWPAGADRRSRAAEARPFLQEVPPLSAESWPSRAASSHLAEVTRPAPEEPPDLPLVASLPMPSPRPQAPSPAAEPEPAATTEPLGDAGAAPAGANLAPAPDGAVAPPAAVAVLDTEAAKQIETLRKGIYKALQEAREILALLDRSPR